MSDFERLKKGTNWSPYSRQIYGSLHPPLFSVDPQQWETLAKDKVKHSQYEYVHGNAGSGATYRANLDAFHRYQIVPRFLRDVSVRDVGITLFGKRYESPIFLAPVGVQEIMHKDAEIAVATAARKTGTPMVFSSASTRTLEEVGQAMGVGEKDGGEMWLQLYWPLHDDVAVSILKRAQKAGYTALVVTLDTFLLGWRPADLDFAYLPFIWGQGCANGFADPAFNKHFGITKNEPVPASAPRPNLFNLFTHYPSTAIKLLLNQAVVKKSTAWMGEVHSGQFKTWKDLQLLRDNWEGPLILKGIQSVADARRAAECGLVDGIVVSNHGGRQLDGAVGSLTALEMITSDEVVKKSNLEIMFDSGIRTGSDVIKAKRLGAKAVFIARPFMYGLALGGEAGVEHIIRSMNADLEISMGEVGCRNWDDVQEMEVMKVGAEPSRL